MNTVSLDRQWSMVSMILVLGLGIRSLPQVYTASIRESISHPVIILAFAISVQSANSLPTAQALSYPVRVSSQTPALPSFPRTPLPKFAMRAKNAIHRKVTPPSPHSHNTTLSILLLRVLSHFGFDSRLFLPRQGGRMCLRVSIETVGIYSIGTSIAVASWW